MIADILPLVETLRERLVAEPRLAGLNILTFAQPSVRLATQRVPYAQVDIGDSRFGGLPDVPSDFEWPRWRPSKQRDDKFAKPWYSEKPVPLGFIAQIDLSALPKVDDVLPSSGWLYFFYDRYCEPWGFDPADRGCCRVTYADCDRSSLVKSQLPSDGDPDHVAEVCMVESWPELTLPDDLSRIKYDTPAYAAYQEIKDELTKAGGFTHHRLLGHPQPIQNPMELECQLASNGVYCGGASHFQETEAKSLEAGATDWRLLLQIDTDEDGPGWMWGDVGRIYFWIKNKDLASLLFTDVWLIFQCC